MRAMLLALFAVLGLLGLAACGHAETPDYPKAKPALWLIAKDGHSAWLFGSIHLLPEGVAWRSAIVDAALRRSDRLVLEAGQLDDTKRTQAIFEEMGRAASAIPLKDRLPASAHARLDTLVRSAGEKDARLARYQSWAVAMMLATAGQSATGLSLGPGVEDQLTAIFRERERPVSGLETVAEQFGAFDALPESAQRRFLFRVVTETGDMKRQYDMLLRAWMTGDTAGMARQFAQEMDHDPELKGPLLEARNARWVTRIEALVRTPGRAFIAVGAGHLVGDESLIALLNARGFRVRRVE